MNSFNQNYNNANINNQINIDGNVSINQQPEHPAVIYLSSSGSRARLFSELTRPYYKSSWFENKKDPRYLSLDDLIKRAERENDYYVILINNKSLSNKKTRMGYIRSFEEFEHILSCYTSTINIGDKIKFNVPSGEYTLCIHPYIPYDRFILLQEFFGAVKRDQGKDINYMRALGFNEPRDVNSIKEYLSIPNATDRPFPASIAFSVHEGEVTSLEFNNGKIKFS